MRRAAASSAAARCSLSTRPDRLAGFDLPSVWIEFTPLAMEHKSINLGQGFPDWEAPAFVKDAMAKATHDNANQYCRSQGLPALVEAVAEHHSGLLGRDLNPLTEVAINVGATEALFATFQAFIEPGDEVILFDCQYDCYAAQIQMAGGKPVYVPMRPKEGGAKAGPDGSFAVGDMFTLNEDELRAAITPRTRAIVVNTPHNPTGKIFSKPELEMIAGVVRDTPGCMVIADEVYEYMVFGDSKHERIATLPDMWERTLTISSAGKTFSCTGWKLGWTIGPASLVSRINMTNQWIQFCVSTPTQTAVAAALKQAAEPYEGASSYFEWVGKEYERKCNLLCEGLLDVGLPPIRPDGGFFAMADTSAVGIPESYLSTPTAACPDMTRDWAFCRWLTIEGGVTPIPPSAFYSGPNKALGANMARFAYCKTDESLLAGIDALRSFLKK